MKNSRCFAARYNLGRAHMRQLHQRPERSIRGEFFKPAGGGKPVGQKSVDDVQAA